MLASNCVFFCRFVQSGLPVKKKSVCRVFRCIKIRTCLAREPGTFVQRDDEVLNVAVSSLTDS
jgi:hypothetical protein